MRKYSSTLIMRLPLMVPAVFFALLSFVMFYICFAETQLQVPSFIQKLCIFLMASFLAWLTFTFLRIGMKDYYLEILPGEDEILFRQLFRSFSLRWLDIKQVHESPSTLSLTTHDGLSANIGADTAHFEELKERVLQKTGKKKDLLPPLPRAPEELAREDRERL
jgi:hypothetical protein